MTSNRSNVIPHLWNSAPLQYFTTLHRGSPHHPSTFPLRYSALRVTKIFSPRSTAFRNAPIIFNPLQYFSTPLHCALRGSNTFQLRSTALRAAPMASRRTYILSRSFLAPNIPPAAPRTKNPSGCIVHRKPRQFQP